MNLRELDRLIARLQENTEQNVDLIIFYKDKRTELLHSICDELIIKEYNVSESCITHILNNTSWKEISTK